MAERSRFQEKAIKNYYENRDNIALQRAQEIVTEIYLTDGKKRERQWTMLKTHLLKLGVKEPTIDHLIASDSPEQVAKLIEKLSD